MTTKKLRSIGSLNLGTGILLLLIFCFRIEYYQIGFDTINWVVFILMIGLAFSGATLRILEAFKIYKETSKAI